MLRPSSRQDLYPALSALRAGKRGSSQLQSGPAEQAEAGPGVAGHSEPPLAAAASFVLEDGKRADRGSTLDLSLLAASPAEQQVAFGAAEDAVPCTHGGVEEDEGEASEACTTASSDSREDCPTELAAGPSTEVEDAEEVEVAAPQLEEVGWAAWSQSLLAGCADLLGSKAW